jgi:hypothetical protein
MLDRPAGLSNSRVDLSDPGQDQANRRLELSATRLDTSDRLAGLSDPA